jgi:hypothetical protein
MNVRLEIMKPDHFPSLVLITIVACAMLLAVIFNAQSQQQRSSDDTVRSSEIQAAQWEYAFRFVGSTNTVEKMTEVANAMADEGWYFVDLEAFTEGTGTNGVDGRHLVFRRLKKQ